MRKIDADVIKNSKPFNKPDLIVYLLAAVLIFALFLCCKPRAEGQIGKMSISRSGETIFSYDFTSGAMYADKEQVSVSESGNTLLVTVYTGETGYNAVQIDKAARSFFVKDANCSARKDCVHSPAVTKGGQSAVCVPHELVFAAEGGSPDRPVVG